MAAGPKLVADRTEHRTEARRVPEALEPLQTLLTPPDELMRILDAVVLAPMAEMGDGWQRDGFRGRIARQPIGHDGGRYHLEPLQEFAKEPLRRSGALPKKPRYGSIFWASPSICGHDVSVGKNAIAPDSCIS